MSTQDASNNSTSATDTSKNSKSATDASNNDIKIDNRLLNLQIVTGRFNSYKTQGKGTSMYKGVCWNSKLKKWQSQIRINDKNKVIGYYINELEASEAYQLKLKTL